MASLYRLAAVLTVASTRVRGRLRAATAGDRGDSPVSTAIIVALLAIAAAGVAYAITKVADQWTAKIPPAP